MDVRRKNSKKRQAILDALCSSKEHPTAEMLYNQLKPGYPELSLGTVYRNLGVLVEEGLAVQVCRVAGQERYDACVAPHAHLVCRCCRKVSDMKLPGEMDGLYRQLGDGSGFLAESCSLTLSGLCLDCRRAKAQ